MEIYENGNSVETNEFFTIVVEMKWQSMANIVVKIESGLPYNM